MFSMGAKFNFGSSMSTINLANPDPTRYSPNYFNLKKRAPSFKIGQGARCNSVSEKNSASTPGPDKYVIKS